MIDRRSFCKTSAFLLAHGIASAHGSSGAEIVVRPEAYAGALRNPLKGLRAMARSKGHPAAAAAKLPYASLVMDYIGWSQIENNASDGVERIRDFCHARWAKLPAMNTKVVPRVYLDWPHEESWWPADLPKGDYGSAQFRQRMQRLIEKLGEAWDNDPRVAFIETGLLGYWGEQHDPEPTPEIEKVMGDAYTASFRSKLLMNRNPAYFKDYNFGIYWDSFGHKEEEPTHLPELESPRLAQRWKTAPMGGETAFDWGTPFGKNPTDALVHNADAILALIRKLHWNHLGWLSEYDQHNEIAVANAARVQQALGYRFVIEEVRYPAQLRAGGASRVSLRVRNTGSSPFYYPWPVEVALLDAATREVRWRKAMPNVDLRTILPDADASSISGEFALPSDLQRGEYLLAVAIVDPAGNRPAAQLATKNYFRGGWHPLGWVGVGAAAKQRALPEFDDPGMDRSLTYQG